jgi:hypothetical protein
VILLFCPREEGQVMAKTFLSGVVVKETLVKARRKWIFGVILVNLV